MVQKTRLLAVAGSSALAMGSVHAQSSVQLYGLIDLSASMRAARLAPAMRTASPGRSWSTTASSPRLATRSATGQALAKTPPTHARRRQPVWRWSTGQSPSPRRSSRTQSWLIPAFSPCFDWRPELTFDTPEVKASALQSGYRWISEPLENYIFRAARLA